MGGLAIYGAERSLAPVNGTAAAAEKCWSHVLVDPAPGCCGTSVSLSSAETPKNFKAGQTATGAKF